MNQRTIRLLSVAVAALIVCLSLPLSVSAANGEQGGLASVSGILVALVALLLPIGARLILRR
ncbi:MAG: hypothetical protein ABFD20_01575 [Anaerolineales bacterium]